MLWIDKLRTVILPSAYDRLRHAIVRVAFWTAFRAAFRAAFWLARPRLLRLRIADARQLHRSRRELATLDAARRADLGITDGQIAAELDKPFLGELSPWASLELRAAENSARQALDRPPRYERSFYRSYGRRDLPQKY